MQKIMLPPEPDPLKLKDIFTNWLPVILIMLVAAIIRLQLTSVADYYLLEGDGPYYPLQVRSLLENFRLGLPDVPLLFIFEASIAKLLQVLNLASPQASILIAIRFTDSFLPPLAAIPVFLISRELSLNVTTKKKLLVYLMLAFAVLNFSTISIFSQGLHKNAIGVIWIFYYSYFIIRILKYSQRKDLYKALVVLLLCAFSHFGSFTFLLLLSCIAGMIWFLKTKTDFKAINYKRIVFFIICFSVFISLIYIFDSGRFTRLISIPFKLFEAPVLLLAMNGQDISSITNPVVLILFNLLSVYGIFVLIFNRKRMSRFSKMIGSIFIIFSLILISPLIGLEWANRLYMIAYIPLTISYLVIFTASSSKAMKIIPVIVFMFMIVLSVTSGIQQPGFRTMTKEAFSEFKNIKDSVSFEKNTVIVGRQDLRLLANWTYRIKGAADYTFSKEDFKKYDAVYVIRQVKGSNFSSNRHRGDAEIPANANLVFCGNYFELYKLNSSNGWNGGKGRTPTLRGTIESIDENSFLVFNRWTASTRKVEFSDNTIIHFIKENKLQKGMYVEVWGEGKAFSLTVQAEQILQKE